MGAQVNLGENRHDDPPCSGLIGTIIQRWLVL